MYAKFFLQIFITMTKSRSTIVIHMSKIISHNYLFEWCKQQIAILRNRKRNGFHATNRKSYKGKSRVRQAVARGRHVFHTELRTVHSPTISSDSNAKRRSSNVQNSPYNII